MPIKNEKMSSSTFHTRVPAAFQHARVRARNALPRGQTLPDAVWLKRHRALVALLALHAVGVPIFALLQGDGAVHALEPGVGLALMAAVAWGLRRRRRIAATVVSAGLITCSALVVHISGGVIEAHFHFFVMIIVLSLYEDWVPFLVAAAYVVIHHGLVSALDPQAVYNHPDALAHPWKWAVIHGGFVAAAGIASVAAWRLNEGARAEATAASRRTRQILETANDAFISIDARELITDWNPQATATFGWSQEEALGRPLSETIIPESHREAHRRGIERFLASEKGTVLGRPLSLRALHRDGHEFPIELTVSPLRTDDGWSFNAFLRDTTEREAAAELLERQRRQLIEAQAIGEFGSWEWDLTTDTLEWSDQLCSIFGLEAGASPPNFDGFLRCVHADDRAYVQGEIERACETGEPFCFDHRIVRPDDAVGVIHSRGEVAMEDGTPVRVLGTMQDISERREIELAKDEFISVVSHELKTPLTSIRGSLGLLGSGALGPLPEKGNRMVEVAVQNTDRLVRLINDILDIEKIDSGTTDMRKEPCEAAELVARATEGLQPFAAEAGVWLCAEAEPATLFADPDRVIQTLTNLISNAVKFSPLAGMVRVSCARREDEVLFQVADEGRGIPADKQDTIFERFQQVDASDSREKGGTGLGLAICRTIVENHDGRIWVESVPGEGSTFSFALLAGTEPDRANGDRAHHDGLAVLPM
jgi:PAS domain S-box-containing protein